MAANVPLVSTAKPLSPLETDRRLSGTGHLPGITGHLFGCAIALLCWQAALLAALLYETIAVEQFIALHVASCLAVIVWVRWHAGSVLIDGPHAVIVHMTVWSFVAGPCGALVAVALGLRRGPDRTCIERARGPERPPASDERGADPAELHLALLGRRVRIENAHCVDSFMDIMTEGSRSEKLEALSVVYRHYDGGLAPVLRRALQDEDMSVRVLGATVMAKLNAKFTRKIGDCHAAFIGDPDIPRNLHDFAEARLAYAESGLINESRSRMEAESAIESLASATEVDPADAEIRASLNRALGKWNIGIATNVDHGNRDSDTGAQVRDADRR